MARTRLELRPLFVVDHVIRRREHSLQAAGLLSPDIDDSGPRHAWFLKVIETLKARSKRLPDFVRDARPFLSDDFEYRPEAVEKHLKGDAASDGRKGIAARLSALRAQLATVEPFTEEATEKALRELAEARREKASDYIHPLRVALVGTAVSPGIFAVLVLIGKERALRRLDRLIAFLQS